MPEQGKTDFSVMATPLREVPEGGQGVRDKDIGIQVLLWRRNVAIPPPTTLWSIPHSGAVSFGG